MHEFKYGERVKSLEERKATSFPGNEVERKVEAKLISFVIRRTGSIGYELSLPGSNLTFESDMYTRK